MEYNKKEHMDVACEHISALINAERGKSDVNVRYIKMDTAEFENFSDFEKQYHNLRLGEEYIIIQLDGMNLYFVCVTFDSVLTAVYEAMRLISDKF